MKKVTEFVKGHRYYLMLLFGVLVATAFTFVIRENASQRLRNEQGNKELNQEPIHYERVAENGEDHNVIDTGDDVEEIGSAGDKVAVAVDSNDEAVVIDSNEEADVIGEEMAELKETSQEEEVAAVFANGNESKVVKDQTVVVEKAQLGFKETDHIIMPIKGQVFIGYDSKNPAYFKTLEHFRINEALFIRPNDSHDVKAVFDGRVLSIEKDSVYGTVVELDHGDGVQSVYGQIDTKQMLKKGDFVKQGEIIGNIAEPTQFFVKEGKHLFFKVLKNDNPIDPMTIVLHE